MFVPIDQVMFTVTAHKGVLDALLIQTAYGAVPVMPDVYSLRKFRGILKLASSSYMQFH